MWIFSYGFSSNTRGSPTGDSLTILKNVAWAKLTILKNATGFENVIFEPVLILLCCILTKSLDYQQLALVKLEVTNLSILLGIFCFFRIL